MAGLTYAENGFIRRNSLIALSEIGVWNDAVRAAAVCALRDRYFEVRSAGLSLAQALAAHVEHDAEITAAVASLANDPRFEVRAAAMSSLGEIGRGSLAVARIGEHFLDGNWKVRAAAARGLTRLVERRAVSPEDRPRIEEAIQGLLPTSTGFKPLFELKDALGGLARALKVHGDVQPPL
jgi:HEAT repeat protein